MVEVISAEISLSELVVVLDELVDVRVRVEYLCLLN
jgi:hypothetical protein